MSSPPDRPDDDPVRPTADDPWGTTPVRRWPRVLAALVGIVVVVVGAVAVVRAVGLSRDDDPGAPAAVLPAPAVTAEAPEPTVPVVVGGVPYEIGVGAFTASERGATPGARLLSAPVLVRNASTAPVPDPLATAALRVGVGVQGVPPAALSGPTALVCRNAEREVAVASPLAPPAPEFRGAAPGECVLDARAAALSTAAAAGPLPPGGEVRGVLVSSPVPAGVPEQRPVTWVRTAPGPPEVWARVG